MIARQIGQKLYVICSDLNPVGPHIGDKLSMLRFPTEFNPVFRVGGAARAFVELDVPAGFNPNLPNAQLAAPISYPEHSLRLTSMGQVTQNVVKDTYACVKLRID